MRGTEKYIGMDLRDPALEDPASVCLRAVLRKERVGAKSDTLLQIRKRARDSPEPL